VNNINWGHVGANADVLTPGATAGDGRCEAGQWGVIAEDVVAYGSLAVLRSWAQSILDQLPVPQGAEAAVTRSRRRTVMVPVVVLVDEADYATAYGDLEDLEQYTEETVRAAAKQQLDLLGWGQVQHPQPEAGS
jgi:hypothetical protein